MNAILESLAKQRAAIKQNLDALLETFDIHQDKAAVRATLGMLADHDRIVEQLKKDLQPQVNHAEATV